MTDQAEAACEHLSSQDTGGEDCGCHRLATRCAPEEGTPGSGHQQRKALSQLANWKKGRDGKVSCYSQTRTTEPIQTWPGNNGGCVGGPELRQTRRGKEGMEKENNGSIPVFTRKRCNHMQTSLLLSGSCLQSHTDSESLYASCCENYRVPSCSPSSYLENAVSHLAPTWKG